MAESATTPAASTADAGKKSFSKMKIGIILGVIVALQCVLAYLYLPSSSDAAKSEAKKEAAAASHTGDKDKDKEKDKDSVAGDARLETREVDLGKFSLTAFDPNSNSTLLIDFHLCGVVAADHDKKEEKGGEHEGHGKKGEGEEDNSPFGKLFKKSKNRFRDQVIVIIRNAQMSDLSDPSLGLIKRQILAKTNSLLGEPLLKEVLFSEFAVVQQ
jgi:flagellar FliL protein